MSFLVEARTGKVPHHLSVRLYVLAHDDVSGVKRLVTHDEDVGQMS